MRGLRGLGLGRGRWRGGEATLETIIWGIIWGIQKPQRPLKGPLDTDDQWPSVGSMDTAMNSP